MNQLCDINYIYEPLTKYRQSIFQHIHAHIPQKTEHLLDLGCGAVGFYWALAYLDHVESITFADQHEDIIQTLAERIDLLSPYSLETEFSDTVTFLEDKGIIQPDFSMNEWLLDFHSRLAGIQRIDALHDTPLQQKADVILAIELFDCANTEDELIKMLRFCAENISESGKLIGNILNYQEWSESLENLAKERLIGRLNPTLQQFEYAAKQAGFHIEQLERQETNMSKFPTSTFFCLQK